MEKVGTLGSASSPDTAPPDLSRHFISKLLDELICIHTHPGPNYKYCSCEILIHIIQDFHPLNLVAFSTQNTKSGLSLMHDTYLLRRIFDCYMTTVSSRVF